MTMKSMRRVLGHSLILSFICSYRALIRLLRSAPSARAPLRSFVNLFAHSFAPEIIGKSFISMNWMLRFHTISTHSFRWCFYVTGLRPAYFSNKGKKSLVNVVRCVDIEYSRCYRWMLLQITMVKKLLQYSPGIIWSSVLEAEAEAEVAEAALFRWKWMRKLLKNFENFILHFMFKRKSFMFQAFFSNPLW